MKKKKFITPKVRVIKIEAEALLAATGDQAGASLTSLENFRGEDGKARKGLFDDDYDN